MKLDLTIDHLELPGIPADSRDELARAIEQELDRLMRSRGPTWDQDGEIEIDRASLHIPAGASLSQIATSIAGQLVDGLRQQHEPQKTAE